MSTFFRLVFANGYQKTSVDLSNHLPKTVAGFTTLLPNVSEVEWYLKIINEAVETGQRTSVSYNSISCYINNEITEIGNFDETDTEILEIMRTKELVDFLVDLKGFLLKYEAGDVPGIIPESKKDDWVIVPKEFVKDEYWNVVLEEE